MDAQVVSKMGIEKTTHKKMDIERLSLRSVIAWVVFIKSGKEKQLDGKVMCKKGWVESCRV